MITIHRKAILTSVIVLAAGWTLAIGGYTLAGGSRMTVEKLRRYVASVEVAALSADSRRDAANQLAVKLNSLTTDERHLARIECPWTRWFPALSAFERDDLIGATLPDDTQNMLTAFDYLPSDLRSRALDESLRRLHADQSLIQTNRDLTPISNEVRQGLLKAGLNDYFTTATTREKIILSPLLEELHQLMETGSMFHGRGRFWGRPSGDRQ
jgi:hypothetical protein